MKRRNKSKRKKGKEKGRKCAMVKKGKKAIFSGENFTCMNLMNTSKIF